MWSDKRVVLVSYILPCSENKSRRTEHGLWKIDLTSAIDFPLGCIDLFKGMPDNDIYTA